MKLPITITLLAGLTALASATPKGQVDASVLDAGARTIKTLEETRRAMIAFKEEYKYTVAHNPVAVIDWIEVDSNAVATMKNFDANLAVMLKTIDKLIINVDDLLTPFGGRVSEQPDGINDQLYKLEEQMDRLKAAYDKQDSIKGFSKEELSAQFRNIKDQLSSLPAAYYKYDDPKAEPTQETLDDLLREAGFEVRKVSGTPPVEVDSTYRKITSLVLQGMAMDTKFVRENLGEWKKHPDFREDMLKEGVRVLETEVELDEMIAQYVDENVDWLKQMHKMRHMTEDELENFYWVMKKKTDQIRKDQKKSKSKCKNGNKKEEL